MRLDIVIPAFNEEDRIDRTLRAYRAGVTEPRTRFLVALDSCTDGTADVVRSHADVDPRVELLEYPKLGKGGVIMESFRRCDADVIGFVDADCATPPAEFLRLVDVAARGRRGDRQPLPPGLRAPHPAADGPEAHQLGLRPVHPGALRPPVPRHPVRCQGRASAGRRAGAAAPVRP